MVSLQIKPNTYYDSITLMIISKELKKVPGVKEALVGMGTDLNLDIAKVTGLSSPELEAITPQRFLRSAGLRKRRGRGCCSQSSGGAAE